VKALLMYSEFPGCPFNWEFYNLTLFYREGTVSLLSFKIVAGWCQVRKLAVNLKQTERKIICCG
jgi:hypothetical protein